LGYMNQLSIWGHAIPSPLSNLNIIPGESMDDYYERVLTKRYEEIKKMLLQELATLTSI